MFVFASSLQIYDEPNICERFFALLQGYRYKTTKSICKLYGQDILQKDSNAHNEILKNDKYINL